MNQQELSTDIPSLTIEERLKVLAELILEIIIEEEGGEDDES